MSGSSPSATALPYSLHTLPVSKIHDVDDIQPRARLSEETIQTYTTLYTEAAEEDPLPPIDVFDIDGTYYVSDGFHRLHAAHRARRLAMTCHVYVGDKQAAMRHGALANLQRGLAYSPADRQRVLERLLQDEQVSQGSNRALGQMLGVSHVTVGRARRRLSALAALQEELPPVPATQGQKAPQRRGHLAAFLQTDTATVARYEQIHRTPLDPDTLITWVARRMTDLNETTAAAKAGVREQVQKEVERRERLRPPRHPRAPKKTPEQQAALEAEKQRQGREDYLCKRLRWFIELLGGREDRPWEAGYTLLDMVAALSPESRQEMPALLSEAEAVIQTMRDALASSLAPAIEA